MKPLYTSLLFSFLVFGLTTKCQSNGEQDFRLLIDGKAYADSINIITKSDLLKMQKVTTNFSWITVKSIIIYFQPYCEAQVRSCLTNLICGEAKALMKILKPGNTVAISIEEAVNKQGAKVHIKDIVFRIK